MKNNCLYFLLVIVLSSCASLKDKEEAKNLAIMAYNVRIAGDSGLKHWSKRKDHVIQQMKEKNVDIYLLQEPLKHQIDDILSQFNNFSVLGEPRTSDKYLRTHNAIFFDNNKFKVIEDKTIWVSKTPLIESIGWDAYGARIITYALLKNKITKDKLYVFNIHLDSKGSESKIKGVQLINEWIQKVNIHNYPVIVGGDFNSKEDSEPIVWFSDYYNDAKTASIAPPKGPLGTFNYFNERFSHIYRIDYIFVNENLRVNSYEVLQEKYGKMYPSDHYPVFVELTIF